MILLFFFTFATTKFMSFMKKSLFVFSFLIGLGFACWAENNMVSINSGLSFPNSDDLNGFCERTGFNYGVEYQRSIFNINNFKIGLNVLAGESFFSVNSDTDGIYVENIINCNEKLKIYNLGLGVFCEKEFAKGFVLQGLVNIVGYNTFYPTMYENSIVAIAPWDIKVIYKKSLKVRYNLGVQAMKFWNNGWGFGLLVKENFTEYDGEREDFVYDRYGRYDEYGIPYPAEIQFVCEPRKYQNNFLDVNLKLVKRF